MYCPCRESIWKRFIDYVLIEDLSAKTAPTYLANFPMRAEIWSLAFLGVRIQMLKFFPLISILLGQNLVAKKRQSLWQFLLLLNNVLNNNTMCFFQQTVRLVRWFLIFACAVECSLTQLKIDENGESDKIDLCTETAAILNLSNLRSIMGCPRGTPSVFTCAFGAKRELQCIFLGEMAIIITPKQGTKIFFPLQPFSRKTQRKIAPKSTHKYWASILDRAHANWASHNTP